MERRGQWRKTTWGFGGSVAMLLASLWLFHSWVMEPAFAQERLRLGYDAIGMTSGGMLTVVQESGMFRKHGLEVQLIYVRGGSLAMQAMIGGEFPVLSTGGGPFLNGALAGADVVAIACWSNRLTHSLVTAKEIMTPEQLKGKKIAISAFGSLTDVAARFAVEKIGLNVDRDVNILQVGSVPTRFAALQSGSVQGAILPIDQMIKAKRQGLRVLVDLAALGLDYQQSGFVTTRSYTRGHADSLRKVTRGLVEGIHFFKTRKEATLKSLDRFLQFGDWAGLEESYQYYERYMPKLPYPTVAGLQLDLDLMAKRNPKARQVKAQDFVDARFIKELDDSGFVEGLYR